ncbi:uncharacterized protein B0P05DRAFT_537948 [Gilbertella persicaria]|uniref:uncharacterized protein n=1 Tax=Gilbertella persicaria TaxID=101096 RepID=UPI00221EBBCB|nr:uncharacterized protein B0P05DRAFT_537948 [Gilbertella persicaria]KAI8082668.1 hypothetical protein B0P05DRAFT_537948 [Gilbertella persicaria]
MELPQVGRHCQLDGCHALDFLPVSCPLCQHTFCGDHRLPLDHHCSQWACVDKQLVQCNICQQLVKAPENASLSPEKALEKHVESRCSLYLYSPTNKKVNDRCNVDKCFDIDPRVGPVHCDGCNRDFCLRHRHPSSHGCQSLETDEKRKLERKLAAQEKLSKTFPMEAMNKKRKVIQSVLVKSKSGGMVELMKMKSQAKGTGSVPAASRIYLYIQCPKESKFDSLPMYFDKKNSVGKALDMIADMCQVNNKNNTLPSTDPQVSFCLFE